MAITRESGSPVSASATGQTTISTPTGTQAGDLLIVSGRVSSATITVTAISGTGTSGWTKVLDFTDATDSRYVYLWMGQATSSGALSLALSFSASVASTGVEIVCDALTNGTGAGTTWTSAQPASVQNGTANSGTSANMPSITPTVSGVLYWGFLRASIATSAGATSGFTYFTTAASDQVAINPNCSSGTAYSPAVTLSSGSNYDTIAALFAAASTTLALAGTASTGSRAPADLFVIVPSNQGVGQAGSSATGTLSLTAGAALGGASRTGSETTGDLFVIVPSDQGTAQTGSRAAGTLATSAALAGTARTAMTAIGDLFVVVPSNQGVAQTGSRATATLTVPSGLALAGAATTGTTGSGDLFVVAPSNQGIGQTASLTVGTLTAPLAVSLTASARSGTRASGTLTVASGQQGAAQSASRGTATLTVKVPLQGNSTGAMRATGALVTSNVLPPPAICEPTAADILGYSSLARPPAYASKVTLAYTSRVTIPAYASVSKPAAYTTKPAVPAYTTKTTLDTLTSLAEIPSC